LFQIPHIAYGLLLLLVCSCTDSSGPDSCPIVTLNLQSTIAGSWESTDCRTAANVSYDSYSMEIASQQSIRVTLSSQGRGMLVLHGANRSLSPERIDFPVYQIQDTFRVRYILPAGSYVLEVRAPSTAPSSGYSLATQLDGAVTCDIVSFAIPPVTIVDRITLLTDCGVAPRGVTEDFVVLGLVAGERITATLASDSFFPEVRIDGVSHRQSGVASIVWTAPRDSLYRVHIGPTQHEFGPYNLRVLK
jgi:hypothetical protein